MTTLCFFFNVLWVHSIFSCSRISLRWNAVGGESNHEFIRNMFVSDGTAQTFFFFLSSSSYFYYFPHLNTDFCLHFILIPWVDFSLGLLNFNTLGITCLIYWWVKRHGCARICCHETAQHLEERCNPAYGETMRIVLSTPSGTASAQDAFHLALFQDKHTGCPETLVDINLSMGLHSFIAADILALLCLLCTIISFSSRNKLNYTFCCSRHN